MHAPTCGGEAPPVRSRGQTPSPEGWECRAESGSRRARAAGPGWRVAGTVDILAWRGSISAGCRGVGGRGVRREPHGGFPALGGAAGQPLWLAAGCLTEKDLFRGTRLPNTYRAPAEIRAALFNLLRPRAHRVRRSSPGGEVAGHLSWAVRHQGCAVHLARPLVGWRAAVQSWGRGCRTFTVGRPRSGLRCSSCFARWWAR